MSDRVGPEWADEILEREIYPFLKSTMEKLIKEDPLPVMLVTPEQHGKYLEALHQFIKEETIPSTKKNSRNSAVL